MDVRDQSEILIEVRFVDIDLRVTGGFDVRIPNGRGTQS
jgi:hypothetical protein